MIKIPWKHFRSFQCKGDYREKRKIYLKGQVTFLKLCLLVVCLALIFFASVDPSTLAQL